MRARALPGFRPSTDGFRFANRWPPGPAFEARAPYLRIGIGEVADGLCGGMCFVAADRYLLGRSIPSDAAVPAPGTDLFREIARRQLDSFDHLVVVPARFWAAAARVAAGRWTARRQVREWRALCADLDAGRPAMAGLVRSAALHPFGLNGNHQVLGYACEASAGLGILRIYDPNHPGRDDIELRIRRWNPAGSEPRLSLEQSTGEPLLALLRLPYRPARPS
jgi:hypothetical protein